MGFYTVELCVPRRAASRSPPKNLLNQQPSGVPCPGSIVVAYTNTISMLMTAEPLRRWVLIGCSRPPASRCIGIIFFIVVGLCGGWCWWLKNVSFSRLGNKFQRLLRFPALVMSEEPAGREELLLLGHVSRLSTLFR